MSTLKKLVYLPIETKSREFDAKCLIALGLLEEDMAVLIGSAGISRVNNPGVVLFKSAAGFEHPNILRFKNKNMKCAVLDEEGFVQTKNEKQRALRYSQQTIDLLDSIFFNGEAEKELLGKFYEIPADKGLVTGNTRFDFYKPALNKYYYNQASSLREKHGKYILITSRFGNVTPARNVGYLDFIKNTRVIQDESDLKIFSDFFNHSKKIYQSFIELIPDLSKAFNDYAIIIRPHPSESIAAWTEAARGQGNVKVISDGPIAPWVLGASAILHNGCTTGLEAFLMQRPVFSFMPYTSDEFDLKLPNEVSTQCFTKESLLDSMHKVLNTSLVVQDDMDSKVQFASFYLANAGASYAYKKIAKGLSTLAQEQPFAEVSTIVQPILSRLKNKIRKVRTFIAIQMHGLQIPLPSIFQEGYYDYQKNPGFSKVEIQSNLLILSELAGVNLAGLVIRKLDEDLFLVYKK
ncbi:MAG: surface carbohydrate biosynthesis protein [Methylophilaceae bacterium]